MSGNTQPLILNDDAVYIREVGEPIRGLRADRLIIDDPHDDPHDYPRDGDDIVDALLYAYQHILGRSSPTPTASGSVRIRSSAPYASVLEYGGPPRRR